MLTYLQITYLYFVFGQLYNNEYGKKKLIDILGSIELPHFRIF